jgi:hypothetical protein
MGDRREEHAFGFMARITKPPAHHIFFDMLQDLKQELKKRDDHDDDCESDDDEEDDEKDKTKSVSPSSKPTKSKCSRPPPTGLPSQPPPTQIGGPATTPAASLQMTVLPLSVSAFPAVFTGASLISAATTRSLDSPATTPPAVPSGTRKNGSSPQPIKTSGHPALSSHSKTALIAFGAISKAVLFSNILTQLTICNSGYRIVRFPNIYGSAMHEA